MALTAALQHLLLEAPVQQPGPSTQQHSALLSEHSSCAAHRCQAIDLVEEDDGGLLALRLLEQRAQLALGLAHPLGQDVGALRAGRGGARARWL
jgi:hypothetical protein